MLLNRRDLVRNGLALSAIAALAPRLAAARCAPADIWVVDRQLPAAALLLAATGSNATPAIGFTADPGPAWMYTLEPQLRRDPVAIGGYTTASTLFCLHYLARDYGLALAGLGLGLQSADALDAVPDALLDLRDPRFTDQRAAYTWLLLPGRA